MTNQTKKTSIKAAYDLLGDLLGIPASDIPEPKPRNPWEPTSLTILTRISRCKNCGLHNTSANPLILLRETNSNTLAIRETSRPESLPSSFSELPIRREALQVAPTSFCDTCVDHLTGTAIRKIFLLQTSFAESTPTKDIFAADKRKAAPDDDLLDILAD